MKTIAIISTILCLILSGCKNESVKTEIKPDFNFTGESHGCASFTVYKSNKKGDATIAVIGNREKLNLSTTEQTFSLSNMNEKDLKVEVSTKKRYCDDIAYDYKLIRIWKGLEGTVKIKITEDSLGLDSLNYKINVIIQDIELENEKGEKIKIDHLEFKEVVVGWKPG